jgi:plasmid stabilization system protein ParE
LIPVQFHFEAEAEFGEAAAFFETKLVGLGVAFAAEVERATLFISAFPDAGSPLGRRLRRIIVRRFPYAIIYRYEAALLLIVAVAHQHRHPGYWRNRR